MSGEPSKIRLDAHETEVDLTPGTTKSDIVGFLYTNDEFGYKPLSLGEHIGRPHNTVKVALRRLKNDGYVSQTANGYYHARSEREDLYRYAGALDGLNRMFADHEERETDTVDEGRVHDATDGETLSDQDIEDVGDIFEEEG